MAKIEASKVREGDFLTGLDNGYVYKTEDNESGYLSYPGYSRYGVAMPEDTVLISFHDAEGQECFLLLPGDFEIEISRVV